MKVKGLITTAFLLIFLIGSMTSCWSDETNPQEIFKKVKSAYESMKTYHSKGTVLMDRDWKGKKITTMTEFEIFLKKPNLYRITWSQKLPLLPNMDQTGSVWNDGSQAYLYIGTQKVYSKMADDKNALASATGISGGVTWAIPMLFLKIYKKDNTLFSRLIDPKLEGSERIADEECYVITGRSNVSAKETFWIAKSNFHIRQYTRSLERPDGEQKMSEFSDEDLAEMLKVMGQDVTEQNKERMKELMEIPKAFSNIKLKGSMTELHVEIASPSLKKKDFSFTVPDGTVFKESLFDFSALFKEVKVESVELVHAGLLKTDKVKKANGRVSPNNVCWYLRDPQFVESADSIKAALKSIMGIAFKPLGNPQGEWTDLTIKFLHPPINNLLTGQVSIQDDSIISARIDEVTSAGWSFDHEWELVSGTWTIQVLKDEKLLLEKKFEVGVAEDIYGLLGEAGMRIKQQKEMVAQVPQNAMYVKDLGNAYLDAGDNQMALVQYTRAIAIEPHPNFYNNRCLAWNNEGEYEKALENCNQALMILPGHTSAFINRGNTYRFLGEYEKAVEDYNQSLKVAPSGDTYNPPMAYYNRALTYKDMGKDDLAIADLENLIKFKPTDAEAYFLRGTIYENKQEIPLAVADYEQVLQLNPQHLEAKSRWMSLKSNTERKN